MSNIVEQLTRATEFNDSLIEDIDGEDVQLHSDELISAPTTKQPKRKRTTSTRVASLGPAVESSGH